MTTEKGDIAATVGAIFWLIGLLLALVMVSVDCIHWARAYFGKKEFKGD